MPREKTSGGKRTRVNVHGDFWKEKSEEAKRPRRQDIYDFSPDAEGISLAGIYPMGREVWSFLRNCEATSTYHQADL